MHHLTDQQLDDQLDAALRALDMDRFNALGAEGDQRTADREARLTSPEALLNAARWYAGQGIPVFPLRVRGKAPLVASAHRDGDPARGTCKGGCGRLGHGLYDATTDLAQINRWWAETPQANIGVPTGGLFDVIDIDGEQGAISYRELRGTDVLPQIYGKATTGRPCSRHLYIAATGDGNATNVWPGIDYRGRGGFVVVPPSRTDRRYDWAKPLDLAGLKAAA